MGWVGRFAGEPLDLWRVPGLVRAAPAGDGSGRGDYGAVWIALVVLRCSPWKVAYLAMKGLCQVRFVGRKIAKLFYGCICKSENPRTTAFSGLSLVTSAGRGFFSDACRCRSGHV